MKSDHFQANYWENEKLRELFITDTLINGNYERLRDVILDAVKDSLPASFFHSKMTVLDWKNIQARLREERPNKHPDMHWKLCLPTNSVAAIELTDEMIAMQIPSYTPGATTQLTRQETYTDTYVFKPGDFLVSDLVKKNVSEICPIFGVDNSALEKMQGFVWKTFPKPFDGEHFLTRTIDRGSFCDTFVKIKEIRSGSGGPAKSQNQEKKRKGGRARHNNGQDWYDGQDQQYQGRNSYNNQGKGQGRGQYDSGRGRGRHNSGRGRGRHDYGRGRGRHNNGGGRGNGYQGGGRGNGPMEVN